MRNDLETPGSARPYRRARRLLTATVMALVIGDMAAAQQAAGAARVTPPLAADGHGGAAPAVVPVPSLPSRRVPTTAARTHSRTGTVPAPRPVAASAPDRAAPPSALPRPPAAVPVPGLAARPVPSPAPRPRPATPPPASVPRPVPTTTSPPAPKPTTTTAPRPAPAPAPAPATATGDPSQSTPPDSAFEQACWTSSPDAGSCNQAALADIDRARAGEGLGPLGLPSDFSSLGPVAQLVVVANAERTSRGLPALAESASLDRYAQQGAAEGRDPTGPAGTTWDSNWALGDPTALAADFSWMYDDGPGSQNVDCTSSDTTGCWGHRHNILSPWSGSAGAGAATYQGRTSLTQLFVKQ